MKAATNFGLPITWLATIIMFSIALPGLFFTTSNLAYILNSQATLLIVAIAVTIPFAAGEFDLSSSGVIIFVVVLVGYLNVLHGWPIGWTVLAALGAGLVIGAINAFMVVRLQISSLIATLAMSFVLGGLALGLNNATLTGISADLINASRSTTAGGIQLVVWYALGVAAIAWYVFQHTAIGKEAVLHRRRPRGGQTLGGARGCLPGTKPDHLRRPHLPCRRAAGRHPGSSGSQRGCKFHVGAVRGRDARVDELLPRTIQRPRYNGRHVLPRHRNHRSSTSRAIRLGHAGLLRDAR